MKINQRLKTIGDLVPFSSCPLDVGCDHALLSIYLVTVHHFSKVFASDNKVGPIKAAKENIKKFQVDSQVILQLASGLDSYNKEIDTVTISGMGGLLISKILEDKKNILPNIKTLIISPNNHVALVRQTIVAYGYEIVEEVVVQNHNLFYPIIVFSKKQKTYNKKDLFLGPILKEQNDPLVIDYYQKLLQDRYQLLEKLPENAKERKKQCQQEIKWLEETLGLLSLKNM